MKIQLETKDIIFDNIAKFNRLEKQFQSMIINYIMWVWLLVKKLVIFAYIDKLRKFKDQYLF